MNPIKEAFQKIKDDINFLKLELNVLKMEIDKINRTQHIQSEIPTFQHILPTHEETPTDNLPSQAPITPNSMSSTGNEGVPTDRQTNQQTDTFPLKFAQPQYLPKFEGEELPQKFAQASSVPNKLDQLDKLSETLNSLDEIKKDLRHKFKRLTNQEMLVFSAIYQLEEQGISPDYSTLAKKLALSESSIRDYVLKITKKGVPVDKIKENNKKILLKIPDDFKKIASLQAIISLREL